MRRPPDNDQDAGIPAQPSGDDTSGAEYVVDLLDAVVQFAEHEGDFVALAREFVRLAQGLTGLSGVSVSTVVGDEVRAVAGIGLLAAATGVHKSAESSLHGIVVATATEQFSSETRGDTRVNREAAESLGVRSLGIVPLRHANHTVALVMLASDQPGVVTPAHSAAIEPLLRAATRRFARELGGQTMNEQLSMLQGAAAASREVLVSDDPGDCLVEAVASLLNAAHVYLYAPVDDALEITHYRGLALVGHRVAIDDTSISGGAFLAARSVVVADWTARHSTTEEIESSLLEGDWRNAKSAVSVPLMTTDGPAGVVTALLEQSITVADAELLGLLGLLAAETGMALSRDRMRRQLADQARTDPLTGLANRRVWDDRLVQEVARAERRSSELAVIIVDLDHFKAYNDSFGHPAGDELLVSAAQAWLGVLRPGDLLARIGGEEFALLLPETDELSAHRIAARIGAVVPSDQTVSIGLTIGQPGADPKQLMALADAALYAAKAAGRNCVAVR